MAQLIHLHSKVAICKALQVDYIEVSMMTRYLALAIDFLGLKSDLHDRSASCNHNTG